MKLEVGMYVRTKNGIAKITRHEHYWINGEEWNYITTDIGRNFEIDLILKASHNIIDLIEVGDYVNGYKVSFKGNDCILGRFIQCDYPVQEGTTNHYRFYEESIKSIVTKEQFESMKYSLEG